MDSILRSKRATWLVGVCVAIAACEPPMGAPDAGSDAATDAPIADRSPPGPASGNGQRCALSADCPSGTFCDLGECIQQCNTRDACTGQFTCTPRGRCAEPDAGVASDPPVQPTAGVFSASPTNVRIEAQESFSLQLTGRGHVRYRIESLPSWLSVPSMRGEFDDTGSVTMSVNRAMLTANDVATIEIVSTQGRSTVSVAAPGDFTGTYRGTVNYTGVRVRAGAAPVPIDLGSTRIGVQLIQDRAVLSARIDTAQSLLWPAGASGSSSPGPATGLGDVQNNAARVRLVQVLDGATLRSLLSESESVFGARTVGRELQFNLQRTSEGRIEGEAIERITGLTSEPIELVGTVSFTRLPGAAAPMFVVGATPALPMGPARSAGTLPMNCTLPAVCVAPATTQQKRDCVGQLMATGFPLHVVHAATEGTGFRVGSLAPPGQTAYSVASENCVADLDEPRNATWRLDIVPPASRGACANFAMLQCARHQGATLFRDADPERAQVAHDVARAWGEAFSLIGNESMVLAWKASVGASSTPASDMRTQFVVARRAYDAGLARIFDPRMLEELRAATPSVVASAPYYASTSPARNDRIALRRAADLLGGSLRATNEIISIDRITSATRPTFRDDVTRDAVLLWIESAILADLDARWRPSDQPVAEVSQLGAVLTTLDRTVASLDANNNALGVAREYVPIIARDPSSTQSNYALLEAAARTSVMTAQSSEATARNATRAFDTSLDTIRQSQMEAETRYLGQITDICGAAFVSGTNVSHDISQCGRAAGNALNTQRQAAIAAQQRLAVSVAAVSAQRQRIENQRDLMIRVREIRASDIRFQSMTCTDVDALMANNVVLQTASKTLSLFGAGDIFTGIFQFLTGAASVVLDTMAAENNRAMARLQCAQQVRSAASGLAEQQAREMAQLQDMLISLEQLGLQTTVDGAELARVYLEIGQTIETVKRLTSEYERVRANASRNFLNDPSFRIERDRSVVVARDDFDTARLRVYYAARGLEYETNRSLPSLLTRAINAQNATQLNEALNCLSNSWLNWQMLTSSPNRYNPEISLRRDILGITGPRTDPETGEVISAGEQFRRALLAQPFTYQGQVWPALRFSTAIREGNTLFSSLVCNSRIASVEAQLVGDFLGDNNATVRVLADGAGMLRTCDSAAGAERVNAWSLRPAGVPAPVTIQAGVNNFGTAGPNTTLLYYPVAQSSWVVAIPTDDASNRDVDPRKIDDIILRITYTGLPTGGASSMFTATCN